MKKSLLPALISLLVPVVAGLGAVEPRPEFAEVTVHDPMVIRVDGTYYVFGSHLASARSDDLMRWTQISERVRTGNPLIPNVFEEMREALEWGESRTFWAGNVIQLEDGRFYFHYSVCRGDAPRSALGLAVSDDVEGPYEHVDILLKSGMWDEESEDGTVYDATVHPNAIDPHTFFDHQGTLWMVYGSYSGGIFILRMDPETGRQLPDQGYGKKLLGGNHARIEAPYILYHPDSEYYYLFLSFGGLSADGGYNIRVARSRNPDGPYVDPMGQDLLEARGAEGTIFDDESIEPYGAKLAGNFQFRNDDGEPGLGYVSPGHNSAYHDADSGKTYIFFHSRFPGTGQRHHVRVHKLLLNAEGWPLMAPHRYTGEERRSWEAEEIAGRYQMVNHGRAISSEIQEPVELQLSEDGRISGEIEGRWALTGDDTVELTLDGETFHSVFLKQWDSGNERPAIAFSGLSSAGVSVWGTALKAEEE